MPALAQIKDGFNAFHDAWRRRSITRKVQGEMRSQRYYKGMIAHLADSITQATGRDVTVDVTNVKGVYAHAPTGGTLNVANGSGGPYQLKFGIEPDPVDGGLNCMVLRDRQGIVSFWPDGTSYKGREESVIRRVNEQAARKARSRQLQNRMA